MNVATATQARSFHLPAGQTDSVEALIRRAMKLVTDREMAITPSRVSRMVRGHIRSCSSLQVAARQLEAYFLTYSDVTGETAIRNVMAGAR